MNALATRIERPAYAALRIFAGVAFSLHGVEKLLGWPRPLPSPPAIGSQLWVGGVLELVCGALIGLGLLARPAAFLASGMMATAYLQFHLSFADWRWLPGMNHGELALIYCFLFLFVSARGAGPVSLDGVLEARKKKRER